MVFLVNVPFFNFVRKDKNEVVATTCNHWHLPIHCPVQIHWPVTGNVGNEVRPAIKDTWRAMEALVREGLVRSIGTSNFSAKKLAEIMAYAEVPPAVCQVEAHPYHRNDKLLAWCRDHDIHFTAFSPLGSPDSESIFPRKVPAVLLKDPTVAAVAAQAGHNVGQVLIRWALERGTSVIPKSTNPARIRGNLDVLSWGLSKAGFTALSTIKFQQRMVNGAMWLNPKGPYRTMEDLWDEPEEMPDESDYPDPDKVVTLEEDQKEVKVEARGRVGSAGGNEGPTAKAVFFGAQEGVKDVSEGLTGRLTSWWSSKTGGGSRDRSNSPQKGGR